jgi:thymidylate kinase
MSMDRLIVFEGPENTGKTTLAESLTKALAAQGHPARYMSFPGKDTASIGKIVYEMDHEPAKFGIKQLHPSSRQVLHLASHLDAIDNRIKPALADKQWVVLDRYWWSMWAHGIAQGLSAELLGHLVAVEASAWLPVKPAAIFTTMRPLPFREEATPEWRAVRASYADLIEQEKGKSPVVALDPNADLDARVRTCLAWLNSRGLLTPTA